MTGRAANPGATSGATSGAKSGAPRAADALVAALAVLLLVLALAGIDLGGYWLRRGRAPVEGAAPATIGHRVVTVPRAWIARPGPEAADGDARLDLAVPWRAVSAGVAGSVPSGAGPLAPGAVLATAPGAALFLTATPGEPPAQAPARVYGRFLTGEAVPVAGGLVRRRFRAGSPFEAEDLYLAGPDGGRFAARCPAVVGTDETASALRPSRGAEPGADCLAVVNLGGLDLRARFAAARLGEWETLLRFLERTFGD